MINFLYTAMPSPLNQFEIRNPLSMDALSPLYEFEVTNYWEFIIFTFFIAISLVGIFILYNLLEAYDKFIRESPNTDKRNGTVKYRVLHKINQQRKYVIRTKMSMSIYSWPLCSEFQFLPDEKLWIVRNLSKGPWMIDPHNLDQMLWISGKQIAPNKEIITYLGTAPEL